VSRVGAVWSNPSATESEIHAIGERIGREFPIGTVIALRGNLGAGKTRLTRGIASGAAVADIGLVSSPTYVLMNVYLADRSNPSSKTVYHIDAYRMADEGEAETLDLAGCRADGIVVIEWPERMESLLPAERVEIALGHTDDPGRRAIAVSGDGALDVRVLIGGDGT
jgi:tRNA threonylcarbamoyladenosine biosynthesis protein TsaE